MVDTNIKRQQKIETLVVYYRITITKCRDKKKFILTGSSSTSNLTNSTSVNLADMAMKAGSIILQGPHQDAEKSTTSFSPTSQNPKNQLTRFQIKRNRIGWDGIDTYQFGGFFDLVEVKLPPSR